jgi:CRISPR-associated protein Csh1
MLNTLLKIGEWQSQDKSKWDRFLDSPKVESKDNRGNTIENYILPIYFDLNNNEIIINKDNLVEFDKKHLDKLKAIKIQGGNNKAIYCTVPANKIIQIYKTFFGKNTSGIKQGELFYAIDDIAPEILSHEEVNTLLKKIYHLKNEFWESFKVIKNNGDEDISISKLNERFELSSNQKIALITIKIKSCLINNSSPIYFSEIPFYNSFLEKKFFPKSKQKTTGNKKKLCYASGTIEENVEGLNLSSRYSLNKMFVEETKNYASYFKEKHFHLNYQVNKQNQEKLDYASDYLLNRGSTRVRIANIDHVIIPQFLEKENVDLELALSNIRNKSDFLFNLKSFESFTTSIEDEIENIYWLNFLAYESDGNFFKSTENIKDVSSFHFQKMLKAFLETHLEFQSFRFLNWNNIMTQYNNTFFFNLNSVYSLIPIRKDKEKKNKALILFKSILENRVVSKKVLYSYFCELILCHYYERYKSYPNVSPSSRDFFYFSVKNSVFKYFAFFEVLKKLKLIDMSEQNNLKAEEKVQQYEQAISDFFKEMGLTIPQQAMFYLGRMLNAVEFIQRDKKKTVIDKVNFHGMDRDDIQRLRISLIEKTKQYRKVGKVIFTDRKFTERFDYNNWSMNTQEAVFFLLSGYSFGVSSKDAQALETNDDTNNQ